MSEEALFNTILISTIIMVGLAIAIILLFNISQRRILHEQKEAHDNELAFQKELLYSNIETQEKERTRIARELHDDIGSKLNVVSLNVRLLKGIYEKGEDPEVVLDHINTAIKSSIERTRDISHELMPPILAKFGVQSALNSLATAINRTGQLRVELAIEQEWPGLDKMKELHIYRIIQELTTNTLKHAKANSIDIKSIVENQTLTISYHDDGIGIKNKDEFLVGLGMSNIYARCKMLNAQSEVKTEINQGVHFNLTIPV